MMRGILDSISIEENNKIMGRGSIKNKKQLLQETSSDNSSNFGLGKTTYLDQN